MCYTNHDYNAVTGITYGKLRKYIKERIIMKLNKRIAAAVLSGCLTVGAVQGAMPLTSFAAITDYDSNDCVWYYDPSLFCPKIRGKKCG